MKISKSTMILEILKKYPKSAEIFNKYNMGCMSCLGVQSESLEKGCLMHGIDVEAVIKDLEAIAK